MIQWRCVDSESEWGPLEVRSHFTFVAYIYLRAYKHIRCIRGGLTNTASNPLRRHCCVCNWLDSLQRTVSPTLHSLPSPSPPLPLPFPLTLLLQVDLLVLAAGRLRGHRDGEVVGRQWGAPNSNYLLVMVSTFVVPFNIPLSPRMTPGCTTQK